MKDIILLCRVAPSITLNETVTVNMAPLRRRRRRLPTTEAELQQWILSCLSEEAEEAAMKHIFTRGRWLPTEAELHNVLSWVPET